jgi:heme/copper-type cytochrome/quinol oxidase subunit 2
MKTLPPFLVVAAMLTPELALAVPSTPSRVLELTAVSKDAVWTFDEVTQSSYWHAAEPHGEADSARRHFTPATIVVRQGERVLVRLRAYDNEHGFYIPDLGIGPFEIKAGETKEFILDATKVAPGAYLYLCTKNKCSDRHHWMRGYVLVYPASGHFDAPPSMADWGAPQVLPEMSQLVQLPAGPSRARGEALFAVKGCVACHNRGGRGGIHNHNYINDTVPRLNNRGEVMMLFETADALKVIEALEQGKDLTLPLLEELGVPRPAATFTQYQNMRKIVACGRPDEGRKDVNGPSPALTMPPWKDELSSEDVNNILAYLLSVSEYDDGTIAESAPPVPEVLAPADYQAALDRFDRHPAGVRLSTGDRVFWAVLLVDAIVLLGFIAFRIRARRPGLEEQQG